MSTAEERVRLLLEQRLAAGGYSAAAVAVAVDGRAAFAFEVGHAATVDETGASLAPDAREAVTPDTMFDLASVTKVVSAHTVLALVADGRLELDRPLAELLPAYRDGAKARITLRHLLTHTSGLPASWHGWEQPLRAELRARRARAGGEAWLRTTPFTDREALLADLLATPLEAAPGERFRYSCAGYNTAMALAEQVTGTPWPRLVDELTLTPLGLGGETGLSFAPRREASAATEFDRDFGRGLLRGAVHDETAWSLGGNSANAGLFGTARGALRLAEALRTGADRILGEWMWAGQLGRMLGPGRERDTPAGYDASLGLRIGQLNMMGAHGREARGHTGFTGTAIQADRSTGISIALLTNRVHPSRHGAGITGLRAAVADAVYEALGRGTVAPARAGATSGFAV